MTIDTLTGMNCYPTPPALRKFVILMFHLTLTISQHIVPTTPTAIPLFYVVSWMGQPVMTAWTRAQLTNIWSLVRATIP